MLIGVRCSDVVITGTQARRISYFIYVLKATDQRGTIIFMSPFVDAADAALLE